jgi:phage terminase large subunit GpA-like protein
VDLFMVGVDEAKLIVMRRLAKNEFGPGYCHVPADREDEWFKQITAEKLTTKYLKGQPKREWTKPDKARNEALDCRVYAYAALKIMNPSFKRLAERLKVPENVKIEQKTPEIIEKQPEIAQKTPVKRSPAAAQPLPAGNPPQDAKPAPAETKPIKRSTKAKKQGGWVHSWR